MFGTAVSPGRCPVCGEKDSACKGPGVTAVVHKEAGVRVRFRSRERVFEMTSPDGGRVKYGVGAPIPLIEALRQGIVTMGQLTPADIDDLRRHDPAILRNVAKEIRDRKNKAVLAPVGTKA